MVPAMAVGPAVAGQVGGQHVVAAGHRLPEVLEHVGGLPAPVQREHRRQAAVAPLEVVDLAVADQREAAAATPRDVVAGRAALGGQRGHGHVVLLARAPDGHRHRDLGGFPCGVAAVYGLRARPPAVV